MGSDRDTNDGDGRRRTSSRGVYILYGGSPGILPQASLHLLPRGRHPPDSSSQEAGAWNRHQDARKHELGRLLVSEDPVAVVGASPEAMINCLRPLSAVPISLHPSSTTVMEFLAQPSPDAPSSAGAAQGANDPETHAAREEADEGSSDGSAGSEGDGCKDEAASKGGRGGRPQRLFGDKAGATSDASTGEAVAVAALASEYGSWLKRLAVRLRRAVPAGSHSVRLRRVSPAVTGDQVGGVRHSPANAEGRRSYVAEPLAHRPSRRSSVFGTHVERAQVEARYRRGVVPVRERSPISWSPERL